MERDDIGAEMTSFRANEKLLSVLSRKSPQQFQLFLDALDQCGQQHVRNVITDRQPGLFDRALHILYCSSGMNLTVDLIKDGRTEKFNLKFSFAFQVGAQCWYRTVSDKLCLCITNVITYTLYQFVCIRPSGPLLFFLDNVKHDRL